jgi:L-ascorbate metabolism protein UlaG (beta-lactamase superfamily)
MCPVKSSSIQRTELKSLLYCGHSAVFLECSKRVIAIDPWLRGNPVCPKLLQDPEQLDIIVLTHGHSDHAGDTVRLARKYQAKIVATWELATLFAEEGVNQDQLVPMNKGGTIEIDGIKISLTHALHSSSFDSSTRGTVYAGEACGAVVSDGKISIYHAGDTCLFQDMSLIEELYKPDVALLPIGDRFTMGPVEAARAATLIGAKVNIPIHFGTFPLLTGTAEEFSAACRENSSIPMVLEVGHKFDISTL